MSAPSFTPGPWKAWPIQMDCSLPYTPVSAKTLLARVYSEAFGDHEESEANARLISAAPDLLEALQRIVDTCGVRIDDPRIVHFDAARAAIAKATGSQP